MSVVAIAKAYGKRQVLKDVSLQVSPGEVVGLLGPKGAGKTFCFSAIIGLTRIESERILLNGEDITPLPMDQRGRRGLGYLPQEPSIFSGMTVAQNICAVLEQFRAAPEARELRAGRTARRIQDRACTLLIGKGAFRRRTRRCEIARAMAANPSIMLLDEPFAGIDPSSILDIKKMVGTLRKDHVGTLITDHNVHEMVELVDQTYIICDGRVIFQGTLKAMLEDDNVRRLYLGEGFTP
ncbi:LPS export ABC transporter ATP-binding protein [Novosphingobium sp. BL-52-GroH]|uniref:LPS export ABC transporter ATP-binding protein n=1 Tax=Novosphingobium sp. BL-52-GroH TaxID=3349877 RepID=UPI00384C9915